MPTLQETITAASPDDVLARAKAFFANRPSLYTAYLDEEGPGFCTFRGQGGEEIAIGVSAATNGGTRVTASSYLFDMQVSRFFSTLDPAPEAAS